MKHFKVLFVVFFSLAFSVSLKAASTWTVTETITMNVGEYVERSFPSSGDECWYSVWESTGDQLLLSQYPYSSDIVNNYNTYYYNIWYGCRLCAVKPGTCYVIATAYRKGGSTSNSVYKRNIYKIIVNGTEPTSMVMQHQLHMGIGETFNLKPTFVPSGTSSTLTWYSTNTSVATVTSAGVVTAKAVGDATITCISANGLREDCNVTVIPTMVSSLSLNQQELRMDVGDQYQFSTIVAPDNASYQQVTWTSMNPDVVSVDANGLVSCLSNGWSVILATTIDGSNLTAGCFVQVGATEGGDANGDGIISISDVTWIIDYLLNT